MKTFLLIILAIICIIIVAFIFCALILASKSDKEKYKI